MRLRAFAIAAGSAVAALDWPVRILAGGHYRSGFAPSSGSGRRGASSHTSCAVVSAPTFDRAFARWCFTVEGDRPRRCAAAFCDPVWLRRAVRLGGSEPVSDAERSARSDDRHVCEQDEADPEQGEDQGDEEEAAIPLPVAPAMASGLVAALSERSASFT